MNGSGRRRDARDGQSRDLTNCEEKIGLRVILSRQRESLLTEGQQRKQRGKKLTVKISITVYKPRNYRAPPTLRLRDESVD